LLFLPGNIFFLVSSSSYSSSDGFPARASNNISPAKEKQTCRQLMLPCSAKFTSKIYAVREFIVGKNGRKCFVLEVKILRCVFVLLPVTNKPLHWIHISQKNAEI